MKNIKIKFRGIDDWNRPVFKDIDSNIYFGSVNTLFNYDDTAEKVLTYFKDHIDELEYFGTHFGCEPMGGISKNITLEIVE
jgi:hypothetical protein